MWTYIGTLDAAGTTLTLEAVGPAFDDPTKTTNYRDVLTLVGRDRKTLTSSAQGPDGAWVEFMRAEFTRVK